MKKSTIVIILVTVIATLFLGSAVPLLGRSQALQAPQGTDLPIGGTVVINLGDSQLVLSRRGITITPTPIPATATRTPTRTNTPNAPTVTRTPSPTGTATIPVTVTAIPSFTATNSGLILPFKTAPLCPTHGNTKWHGLWDSVRGCHYDHTHNDNPALGDSVFGPVQLPQTISYPWLTSNENDMHGHPGYKYYVNLAPFPACANESWEYLGTVNCVSAFRIQYHDVGTNSHMVKRFHSYYMEVQIKKGNTTGTIRTGGWADSGCLHGAYKEFFIALPGIDPTNADGTTRCKTGQGGQGLDPDPYRGFGNTWAEVQAGATADHFGIWTTSNNKYGYNKLGGFFFRTLDPFGAIDAANPNADHFICPDFKCKFNNSEHHVFTVFMTIPSSLDNLAGFDTNPAVGIITGEGYTGVEGARNAGCTAPNSNCVPLQLINVPVGTAIWGRNLSGLRPEGDPVHDSDIYFNGQPSGWILPSPHP